jgi:DNA-binding response OmpR family regulator
MTSPAVAAFVSPAGPRETFPEPLRTHSSANPLSNPNLRLTKKERQLLSILIQNPGKCISREILLRTVWNYSEGAKTRTVDVHVQRLRRKLGAEGGASIKTIVRGGYCWFPELRRV